MRRALILAEHLRVHPESRFRAEVSDQPIQSWHWPSVQSVLADMFDRVTALIAATGGVEATAEDMYPRPRLRTKDDEKKTSTVADFDVAGFLRQINS